MIANFVLILGILSISTAKLILERIKNCDDFDHETNALYFKNFNLNTKNGFAKATGTILINEPIGSNLNAVTEIFVSMNGKKFVKMATQHDKDPCVALGKKLGQAWADIERNAKMTVGQCPLQKGSYDINISLDLDKIPIPLPPGTLKLVINGFNKASKARRYCAEINLKSEM